MYFIFTRKLLSHIFHEKIPSHMFFLIVLTINSASIFWLTHKYISLQVPSNHFEYLLSSVSSFHFAWLPIYEKIFYVILYLASKYTFFILINPISINSHPPDLKTKLFWFHYWTCPRTGYYVCITNLSRIHRNFCSYHADKVISAT